MTFKLPEIPTVCLALSLAGSPLIFSQDEGEPFQDELVLIPEGPFEMGNFFERTLSEGFEHEFPVHSVYVSEFYLGKHEVTQGLWDEVQAWAVGQGYDLDVAKNGRGPDHPVHSVGWQDAVKWCNARSEKEGLQPCYWIGKEVYKQGGSSGVRCDWSADGYRLPTEAEWEKAARGGLEGKRFPWGDTISHNEANYAAFPYWVDPGSPFVPEYDVSETAGYHPAYKEDEDIPPPFVEEAYTAPVESFEENGYGLYDVAGNVSEWCWDWWDENYYTVSPVQDPKGPDVGSRKIYRGGTWFGGPSLCRVACRGQTPVRSSAPFMFGLRIARTSIGTPVSFVLLRIIPHALQDGRSVRLTWASVEGERYRVMCSLDLSKWQLRETRINATPPLNIFIDDEVPLSRRAFYKVHTIK